MAGAGPSRVCNMTFAWRKSTPKDMIEKKARRRHVKKAKKAANSFSHVGNTALKRVSVQSIGRMMEKIRAKPVSNKMAILRYS